MEQSNPPLRASNIADIKAKVAEMVGQGGGTTSATPGGYAYVLYQGDSSTNSITLSDSAFNYDKLVIEGYYMAMGSAAMDIAITAEWPKNKDKRKFQITTNDLTTGDTPALTVNTDVWEVSEDGLDLDLVLALQGIDTDNITVIPESTSQITITKVIGFNNISSGPANKPSYDVPYFDGGDYGVVAYLDRDNNVAYYTATSANDLQLAAPNSGASYYTIKTLANGENITNNNIVAFSWGSQITSIPNYTLLRCRLLQSVYGLESSAVTTIGSGFLRECASFNQPLALPDTVTTIGDNFLQGCSSFLQPLTIPATVRTISVSYFMNNCYSFIGPLTINSPASISADTFALATALSTAPMYTTGVTLQGLNASLWKSTLDDRTSSPFRKLTIAEETTE